MAVPFPIKELQMRAILSLFVRNSVYRWREWMTRPITIYVRPRPSLREEQR